MIKMLEKISKLLSKTQTSNPGLYILGAIIVTLLGQVSYLAIMLKNS